MERSGQEKGATWLVKSGQLRVGLLLALVLSVLVVGLALDGATATARPMAELAFPYGVLEIAGLPVTTRLSDSTSAWENFEPSGWVTSTSPACTVRVTDSEGLQESTACYRYSINGGESWTDCVNDNLLISGELSITKYITVTGIAFVQSITIATNQIQYEIRDSNDITDTSPAYPIKVDSYAPAAPLTLTVSPGDWTSANAFDVSWTNPADTSGIAGVYYKLNAAPASPTDGIFMAGADIHTLTGISVPGEGVHILYAWLRDQAGNVDHTQHATATLRYDGTPPGAPLALTVSPNTWTPVNAFDVSWTNPADTSGIAGVYYKLDAVPASSVDGVFVAGTDIHALAGISVPGEGEHTIYVWLQDRAGNTDHTRYAAATLRYDGTPPDAPIALTSSPDTWTNVNSFSVGWINPADVSGIVGAYYKLNVAPSSPIDGVFIAGANIQTITGISVPGEGAHTIYVWLRDLVGNADHTRAATTVLRFDNLAPAAPGALTATPGTWTNVNSFGLSWNNPLDVSGIAGAYYKLDAIPASPTDGTFVSGDDLSSLSNISVSGTGLHPVYVWLRDKAGNTNHNHRAQTILYFDATPPSPPTILHSSSHLVGVWSNDHIVDVYWSGASDAHSGVGGYAILWDQLPTSLPAPTLVTTETTASSPPLSDGNSHYVHLRTRDNAGNWTADALHLGPFYIDRQAPSAPIFLTAHPITWTNVNSFSLTWNNPADLSEIAGAYYKLDNPPAFNTDGTWVSGEDLEALHGIAVTGDGVHPIYVWLKDRAGNINFANRASTELYFDSVRPDTPTNLTPSPAQWTNVPTFAISWTNPVDMSGIAGAYYKLDAEPASSTDGTWVETQNQITGISITQEGAHSIYLWLKDRAGNTDYRTRAVLPNAFKYDRTAPTTTHQLAGTLGQNGWYTSSVNVSLSAQDNLSGVAQTRYRINEGAWQTTTSFSLTVSGIYTVEYHSIDIAGNQELTRSLQVKLDRQAPVTSVVLSGTLGLNGWYTSSVQVRLVPEDPVSGVAETRYRLDGGAWVSGTTFTLDSDGIHQLEYYSRDVAGNRETTKVETIKVDMQPPITFHSLSGVAGDAGWFLSPVTVTLSATDLASGPAATYYKIDVGNWISGTQFVVAGENIHTVRFYTRDQAGNVEPIHTLNVNIDMTPPLSPIGPHASPVGWTNTNAFTVTWTSPLDLSGIGGAYYKLNDPPSHRTDGIYVAGATSQITGIAVPSEGKHKVYLWLRDGAGNTNHLTRNIPDEELWFDATPPNSMLIPTGSVGQNGWYTSTVRITLSAEDPLSGVSRYYHRFLGQDWEEGGVFQITTSGRHTIQYYAVDNAGNVEPAKSAFVRVDLDAPGAPIGLRGEPTGWRNTNTFSAIWTDPIDTSGISAAYYKLDAPPASPRDGTLVAGPLGRIDGIQVTGEGKHSLYVWLMDNAGNVDHTHYAYAGNLFWYDPQPPTTTHTISGTLGTAGWYRSAVTVTLSVVDVSSGPATTRYRINGGTWRTGTSFALTADGTHTIEYYSIDNAGNTEPTRSAIIQIDTQPPISQVTAPSGYQENSVVTLVWSGSDPAPGSGVLYYDIEYKDGLLGTWTAWRTATSDTSGLFVGQRGHVYYFRSRAWDRAGNVEAFPPDHGDRYIYIEPVANGRFETRDLSSWTADGVLGKRVELIAAHGGGTSYGAVLGNPELGPCYDTQPPVLPIGSAVISQTVYVPAQSDIVVPFLHFWYHIITYDVVWSHRYQRFYDSFDVELSVPGGTGPVLLLRDGNYDPDKVGSGYPPVDLGWKEGVIDLSAYAGQTVTLYFRVSNRVDQYFNTWVYLDDVSIVAGQPAYRVYLPLMTKRLSGQLAMEGETATKGVPTRAGGRVPPR